MQRIRSKGVEKLISTGRNHNQLGIMQKIII